MGELGTLMLGVVGAELVVVLAGVSEAWSSPVSSLKLKTWVGVRKSAVISAGARGVGWVEVGCSVEIG